VDTRRRYRSPDAEAFAALMKQRGVAGYLAEPMPPLEVRDRYLDTEDAALLREGLLLRVREHNGAFSASLRPAEGEGVEEIAQARYQEPLSLEGEDLHLPPGALREAVEAHAGDRPLRLLLHLHQYRTPRALYDGDRLAGVLSLDVVSDETVAEQGEVANEVEAELVQGGLPTDLRRLDAELQRLGFAPDALSKFERGLLRRGRGEDAPLYLLPRERALLVGLRDSESAVERRRAEVILLAARGEGTREISRAVGLSPSRVRHWRAAFRQERLGVFDVDTPEPELEEEPDSDRPAFHVTEVLSAVALDDETSPEPAADAQEDEPASDPFAETPLPEAPAEGDSERGDTALWEAEGAEAFEATPEPSGEETSDEEEPSDEEPEGPAYGAETPAELVVAESMGAAAVSLDYDAALSPDAPVEAVASALEACARVLRLFRTHRPLLPEVAATLADQAEGLYRTLAEVASVDRAIAALGAPESLAPALARTVWVVERRQTLAALEESGGLPALADEATRLAQDLQDHAAEGSGTPLRYVYGEWVWAHFSAVRRHETDPPDLDRLRESLLALEGVLALVPGPRSREALGHLRPLRATLTDYLHAHDLARRLDRFVESWAEPGGVDPGPLAALRDSAHERAAGGNLPALLAALAAPATRDAIGRAAAAL
jgi:hypothetical protein